MDGNGNSAPMTATQRRLLPFEFVEFLGVDVSL
jgi:hypothetical protein